MQIRQVLPTLACLVLLLVLCVLASLLLGAKTLAPAQVWLALFGEQHHPDNIIVQQGRLPRTLLGLLAGMALGMAGTLIQNLTRNPLADPGILGVNAGASLAVIIGVAWLGSDGPLALMSLAFAGALFTTLLVCLLGALGGDRHNVLRFVLAGVAVGAVMGGLSSAITLLDPATFDRVRYWAAGTLDIRTLEPLSIMAPVVLTACLAGMLLAGPLNTLSLGKDLAISLGSRPLLIQSACIIVITLLCGTATAIAGPIGFVGLMIPHLARRLAANKLHWTLLFSLLLAPCLLLLADVLGRLLLPGELRVSIVTAFIGAPVLVWLARQQRSS